METRGIISTLGFVAAMFLGTTVLAQIIPQVEPTRVLIETTARAEIFLDGVSMGNAPSTGSFTIPNAKPGPHELRVIASGKRPLTRKIVLAAGKINRFRADLEDFTGDLEVLTAPDAEILLDGKSAGAADGTGRLILRGIKARGYQLRAARTGYNAEERSVTVASGVLSTFTVDLKRIEAAEGSASLPPPDYVMERRLSHRQARSLYFGLNSLRLISVGSGGDNTDDSNDDRLIEWDLSTGRRLKKGVVGFAETIESISADLRWAAVSSSGRGAIKVLDTATGSVFREWPGIHAEFTPDSKTVVISAAENEPEVVFWDIESGKRVRESSIGGGWMFYSPYGRWLATRYREGTTIRDAETLEVIQRLATKKCCRGAAFSPDGRWLAIMADTKMELWEVATGRQGRTIEGARGPGQALQFSQAVFTSDSRYIIVTHGMDFRLWDTFTGKELRKWPLEGASEVALSPDGKWLAATVSGGVTVWRRVD